MPRSLPSPHVAGVVAVLACAACKSDLDEARAIIADPSRSSAEALVSAGEIIWRGVPHQITPDCHDGACRLFVILDRDEQPSVDTRGSGVEIKFFQYLDGKALSLMSSMLGVGLPRQLTAVFAADRYHCNVLGKPTTIVDLSQVHLTRDHQFQFSNEWDPADMVRLGAYDLIMNDPGIPPTSPDVPAAHP